MVKKQQILRFNIRNSRSLCIFICLIVNCLPCFSQNNEILAPYNSIGLVCGEHFYNINKNLVEIGVSKAQTIHGYQYEAYSLSTLISVNNQKSIGINGNIWTTSLFSYNTLSRLLTFGIGSSYFLLPSQELFVNPMLGVGYYGIHLVYQYNFNVLNYNSSNQNLVLRINLGLIKLK